MMDRAEAMFADLGAIVGANHVLTGDAVRQRWDGYPPVHEMEAACIVRPANTAEVAAVAAYCNRHRLHLVPQGGRTGLAGGAVTKPGDIALSLERMNAIGPIDTAGLTLDVEAGAVLQAVQEAAASAGFLYPVDLGARGSATIGGTIATNAGGNSVLRYGMTRHQVLGLEVVLADGTVLSSLNRLIKNNAAFDLKQIFIGSEGTLGIITRAVLRLQPAPGEKAAAFIGLPSFGAVLDLLALISSEADGALTSYEVMWPSFFDSVLAHGSHRAPLDGEHAFYVLAEIVCSRSSQVLDHVIALALERGLLDDASIAQNLAQANAFWAIRDDIEGLVRAMHPVLAYDVSLPQVHMDSYIRHLETSLRGDQTGLKLAVFGHVADGNLHVIVGQVASEQHAMIDACVYPPLQDIGGSVSAEHGIGIEKREVLHFSRSHAEIEMMHRLKGLLDPHSILNPGKVIPNDARG